MIGMMMLLGMIVVMMMMIGMMIDDTEHDDVTYILTYSHIYSLVYIVFIQLYLSK